MQQREEKKKEFIQNIIDAICGKLRLTFCDYTGYNPDMLFEIVYEDIWRRDGYSDFISLLAWRVKHDLGGFKIKTLDEFKELICELNNYDDYYEYWKNAKQAKEEKYEDSYEQLKTKLSSYNNKKELFSKLDTGYYVDLKHLLSDVEKNKDTLSELSELIDEICRLRYEPEYIKQLRKFWSCVLFYSKPVIGNSADHDRERANKAGISSKEHPLKEDYHVVCHGIITSLDQLIEIMELIAKNKTYLYLHDVCGLIMELALKEGESKWSKENSIKEMFKNITPEQLNKIVNLEKDIYSSANKYDPELGVLEGCDHLFWHSLSMTEYILQNNGDINIIKQTINSIVENNLSASYCCWRDIYKNFSTHKFKLTYDEMTKLVKLLYNQECNLSGESLTDSIKTILECCSDDMTNSNKKLNLNEVFDLNKPDIPLGKPKINGRPRDYFGTFGTYEQFFKLIDEHIDYIEFDENFMNKIFNSQMFFGHNDIESYYESFINQLKSVRSGDGLKPYSEVARHALNILEKEKMTNLRQWFVDNIADELRQEIISNKDDDVIKIKEEKAEKEQQKGNKVNNQGEMMNNQKNYSNLNNGQKDANINLQNDHKEQKEQEEKKQKENEKQEKLEKEKEKEIEKQKQEKEQKEKKLVEKKETQTAITNINNTNSLVNNNPQNDNVDIEQIVNNSENFADFCGKLKNQNVDFNQINFDGEPLGFWDLFMALLYVISHFFSCRTMVINFGFWNFVCLKADYENARSKLNELSNLQSQNPEEQSKTNIKYLSESLKNAQEKANENPNLVENSQNPIK